MELKDDVRRYIIIDNDEELEIIKKAIDYYHDHLMIANKDKPKESEEHKKLILLLMKIEEMCQILNIPGYEFN